MRRVFLVLMLASTMISVAQASDTVYDIFGQISRFDEWPIYNGTSLQGYQKTITVNGQAYPLDPKVKVLRKIRPPAMYPTELASLSHVTPGINVDLRLSGHMVFEIIIER